MTVRELDRRELRLAIPALLELRPHAGPAEALGMALERADEGGYRIAAAFVEGEDDAAAVAGFRTGRNLAWGAFLYVDDLVTRAAFRRRGCAAALLAWIDDEAARGGVGQLHLDSGTVPERHDAHAAYFRAGWRIEAHHFVKRP